MDSSKRKCRIVIDVMGGDFAPGNNILGIRQVLEESQNLRSNLQIILAGKKAEIEKSAAEHKLDLSKVEILDCDDVIEMSDSPVQAVRVKKESSIVKGMYYVKEGNADAFVSAGNTGAMMAASTFILGRIPGVERPTIGTMLPNVYGVCAVFDAGANVDAKPHHLVEHAVLGSIFAREILNKPNPTVGLLNVGEEEGKGNEVVKKAHELLRETKLNFVGNVEGKDILKSNIDVVVCDGFIGNIVLKFAEGVIVLLKHLIKSYADASLTNKLKIGLVKNSFREIFSDLNYEKYGGVPLLGVNHISIIGHGSSSPLAIKNMILKAAEMHEKDLINKLKEAVKAHLG